MPRVIRWSRSRNTCTGKGHRDRGRLESIVRQVEEEVQWRRISRSRRLQPRAVTSISYVYSADVDPTSEQFDTEDDPRFTGDPTTMVDLLNICLRDEMTRDPRIVVFGEDVADCSREKNLGDVKGKGGVFKVTWGLQRAFGSDRVYNSPLAEANIIGRAIGLATRGLKPVVEIQFFDYIWPAYMQLRNELALMRWRSNNAFCVAGRGAGDLRRISQGRLGVSFADRGSRVHRRSRAPGRLSLDLTRRQRAASHRDSLRGSGAVPRAQAPLPPDLQQGAESRPQLHDPVRQGQGGAGGHRPHRRHLRRRGAAGHAGGEGNGRASTASASEVIDLRSLSPVDWDTIYGSVRKTSRVIVAYEDSLSWGYGAEIAARIADEAFTWLDAPVRARRGDRYLRGLCARSWRT